MITIREQERNRWRGMLQRCEDPRASGYHRYGGRGIKVCEAWHDFEAYFADIMRLLGPCPGGMSIDRIDNDGNYEPGNVRWATGRMQALNSRTCDPAHRSRWQKALAEQRAAALAEAEEAGRLEIERQRAAAERQRKEMHMFRPAEVCAALGIEREQLVTLINTGELAAITVSVSGRPRYGSLRISELSLEEYVARRLPQSLAVTS